MSARVTTTPQIVQTDNHPMARVFADAEEAVRAVESVPPGQGLGPTMLAARSAFTGLLAAIQAELVPDVLTDVGQAALMDLNDIASVTPGSDIVPTLVSTRAAALAGDYRSLAVTIAGPRGLRLVRQAADVDAARRGLSAAAAVSHVAVTVRRFLEGLAYQDALAKPEAARVLLEALPQLEARLDAVDATHQAHAALQSRQAAADAEVLAAADEQAMIRFFKQAPNRVFTIGQYFNSEDVTGSQLTVVLARERGRTPASELGAAARRLWNRAKSQEAPARQLLQEEIARTAAAAVRA